MSATSLVTFSGICPRLDNSYATGRGKELNSRIKELADTEGCCFVGHEGTFLCKNGEINDALLLVDGLHLSAAGSKRLLNNLSLSSHTTISLGRKITAKLRAGPQHNSHEAGNAQDARIAQVVARPPRGWQGPHHAPEPTHKGSDLRPQQRPWHDRGHPTKNRPAPRQAYRTMDSRYEPEGRRQNDDHHLKPWRRDDARGTNTTWHERHAGLERDSNHEHYQREPSENKLNIYTRNVTDKQSRCWYCNEAGHTYRQCRHGDYVQCHSCHKTGHKAKHCSSRQLY